MDIQISGRHVAVSDGFREVATQKVEHVCRLAQNVQRVTVTIWKDAADSVVEIVMAIPRGKNVVAESRAESFAKALDLVIDKVEHQMSRFKEKVKDRRHKVSMGEAAAEAAETQEPSEREETKP